MVTVVSLRGVPASFGVEGQSETNSRRLDPIFIYMRMKVPFAAMFLAAVMLMLPAVGWTQQPAQDNGAQAKHDMKKAGHESKGAARDAGNGVKHGTKKAYHSTKRGTKKAYHKTKNTVKGAAHGAKQGAQRPTDQAPPR